jgi:aryl-alcohol dehydrogenase-like predicted oxidoreductase
MPQAFAAGAEISTNQIQYSLLDRRPEQTMAPYCRDNGIQILPYGVVAGGLLTDRFISVKAGVTTSALFK